MFGDVEPFIAIFIPILVFQNVILVDILSKGYDQPTASCLIAARPTKSLILHVQQVGRVLRPAPGKHDAIVLDHSGNTSRLGFVTDPLPATLDDGTHKTSKTLTNASRCCKPCVLPKSGKTRRIRLRLI